MWVKEEWVSRYSIASELLFTHMIMIIIITITIILIIITMIKKQVFFQNYLRPPHFNVLKNGHLVKTAIHSLIKKTR